MTKRRFQSGEKRRGGGDRDARGRLRPGHRLPGPGRPRGRDLRALVDKKARETGVDVDDALWGIVRAMVTAARGGDVAAARELFNRLCDNDPLAVTVDLAAPPPGPPVPQDLGAYVAAFAEAVDELQARERENAAKAGKPAQH